MSWVWANVSTCLTELINNEQIREEFIKFDVSELRAQEITHALCIGNFIEQADNIASETAKKDEVIYTCDLSLATGDQCNMKFNSNRKLVMRQKKAKLHKDAYIYTSSLFYYHEPVPMV